LLGGGAPEQLNWRAVESLGHAYFHQRGWRVLLSVYDTGSYDFVAERDDLFVRVNVKQASVVGGTYMIAKPGKNRTAKDPDLYLVWLPKEQTFLELPGDFLQQKSSRRIPVALTREAPTQ
jgi:Holliday junction resolvase-like predicted endonuclease